MSQLFNFCEQEIRFVGDKPVANDVALVLGYADPSRAVNSHVSSRNKTWADELPAPRIDKIRGNRVNGGYVLEETGIYQLISLNFP